MGPYEHCYSRVYAFNQSRAPGVDATWDAWRNHARINMKEQPEEQIGNDVKKQAKEEAEHEAEEAFKNKTKTAPKAATIEENTDRQSKLWWESPRLPATSQACVHWLQSPHHAGPQQELRVHQAGGQSRGPVQDQALQGHPLPRVPPQPA